MVNGLSNWWKAAIVTGNGLNTQGHGTHEYKWKGIFCTSTILPALVVGAGSFWFHHFSVASSTLWCKSMVGNTNVMCINGEELRLCSGTRPGTSLWQLTRPHPLATGRTPSSSASFIFTCRGRVCIETLHLRKAPLLFFFIMFASLCLKMP